jgi:hypothetical protein
VVSREGALRAWYVAALSSPPSPARRCPRGIGLYAGELVKEGDAFLAGVTMRCVSVSTGFNRRYARIATDRQKAETGASLSRQATNQYTPVVNVRPEAQTDTIL